MARRSARRKRHELLWAVPHKSREEAEAELEEGSVPYGTRIYFIEAGDGTIKIGRSANPGARMRDMQVAHSQPLTLLGTIPGGRPEEDILHQRFWRYHIRGEWFASEIKPLVVWMIDRERRRIDDLAA